MVVVGAQHGACFHLPASEQCQAVKEGMEQFCPDARVASISCNGGLCQVIRVCSFFAFPIHSNIPPNIAAPLLSEGIRVYTALSRLSLNSDMVCGIVGDRDCVMYKIASEFIQKLSNNFGVIGQDKHNSWDVVLITSGCQESLESIVARLKPFGKIVLISSEPIQASTSALLHLKNISLIGNSPITSIRETKQMLKLIGESENVWRGNIGNLVQVSPHTELDRLNLTTKSCFMRVIDMAGITEI